MARKYSALCLLAGVAVLAMAPAYVLAPAPASAAAITVTTDADVAPPPNDSLCSLREAIMNANADALTHDIVFWQAPGNDTIDFEAGVTSINVASGLAAGLPVFTDADGLTIDGGDHPDGAVPRYRLTEVTIDSVERFWGTPIATERPIRAITRQNCDLWLIGRRWARWNRALAWVTRFNWPIPAKERQIPLAVTALAY